ncbi:MAG TPA: mercury resistance system periplasmic binding protein MerP [Luteimonas sp.]|nr:mercury resistance system periplasmic binding protein MerP [Luteimonas sp.]
MKRLATILILGLAFAAPTWAAIKTVSLAVPGMTCATCPITVKRALNKVDGVTRVEVSYEKKEAVVTFDDAKTAVKTLTDATTNAGYPSTAKK